MTLHLVTPYVAPVDFAAGEHSPEDAQDLTQEVFARLLERKWMSEAEQALARSYRNL